ncbi:IclR family transcriptional regulator [Hoeflea sp.]|uniref:IclR family transcriptional regulator n=1 Tax=Hoeflea sp. TaxID=1940281 RepID=UPI003A90D57C
MTGEAVEEVKEKRKYLVPSVETSFKILKLLSSSQHRESTLTQIAKELSINVSTCFRILQVLEEMSVVHYNKRTKQYTLGSYLVILGERAKEYMSYIRLCRPYLEDISRKTGLTSVLIQRIRPSKLAYVDKVDGSDFSINITVGKRFDVADGSFGMCFVAHMNEADRKLYLEANNVFKQKNPEEKDEYLRRVNQVKEQGYAITYGDFSKGIFGLSAPVFNEEGEVILTISAFGATTVSQREDLESIGEIVKAAAADASRKLGGI